MSPVTVLVLSWGLILLMLMATKDLSNMLLPPMLDVWLVYMVLVTEPEPLTALLIGFLVAVGLAMRFLMIILGVFKEPILSSFQKYGDEETRFYPLPSFLFWLGAMAMIGGEWMGMMLNSAFPSAAVGVSLIVMGAFIYYIMEHKKVVGYEVLFYPRWLYELKERTSRGERRRLAYMWVRLPWRTRLAYNSDDQAFMQWADFVILSTFM